MPILNVIIDTSPLHDGNSHRGVGIYTRLLSEFLGKQPDLQVFELKESTQLGGVQKKVSADQPTVLHYPYFDFFFSTLPFRRPYPTVVTIHDVIPLQFPKEYKPGVKGRLRFYRQKAALRSVKAVITDSEASAVELRRRMHVAEDKIHVVPLAAAPEFEKPTSSQLQNTQQHFNLPENYVLYVGDINYNKNIPQLVKMMKFLPEEIHLVCMGRNFQAHEIPEWQAIERQVALSDVTARVHFISDIAGKEYETLSALYHGAIAYVQPSLAEGFGLPILEAMKCEVPVVASDIPVLREVAGEYALFALPIAEELAVQVKEVFSWSSQKRGRWVKAGLNWTKQFTWKKTAEKTRQVYEAVCQQK